MRVMKSKGRLSNSLLSLVGFALQGGISDDPQNVYHANEEAVQKVFASTRLMKNLDVAISTYESQFRRTHRSSYRNGRYVLAC